MNADLTTNYRRASRSQHALTLIELIGVLAVIAILAAVLVPALIRQADKAVGDQETASLKSFGDSLVQSVLRSRSIPSDANWASTVATELGVEIANVTTNPRKQPRLFLIDPNVNINGGSLPYTQNIGGSTNLPVSARVIILASVGRALPVALVSGVQSAANFTNIWDAADGTVPAAPVFAGWVGNGDDLKIQRVNLVPFFARLVLTRNPSSTTTNGYSIDTTNFAASIYVALGPGIDRYFIQNSVLTLYRQAGIIDSQQILIRDNSFVYDENVWRGSLIGGSTVGGLDIATVVDKFLSAPPNLNPNVPSGTNQQAVIVTNMMSFMSAYNAWAGSGFPNGGLKTAAGNAQSTMILSVRKIFEPGGGANDFTPWNTNSCLP